MVDLFVGRPFLRPFLPGTYEWQQVVLVLRDNRLSLTTPQGVIFDVVATAVAARFTATATMILEVEGRSYEVSNLPPSWAAPLTSSMIDVVQALNAEETANYAVHGMKPPKGTFANWGRFLTEAGATVEREGDRSEDTLSRISCFGSLALLVGIAGLIVYLMVRA